MSTPVDALRRLSGNRCIHTREDVRVLVISHCSTSILTEMASPWRPQLCRESPSVHGKRIEMLYPVSGLRLAIQRRLRSPGGWCCVGQRHRIHPMRIPVDLHDRSTGEGNKTSIPQHRPSGRHHGVGAGIHHTVGKKTAAVL